MGIYGMRKKDKKTPSNGRETLTVQRFHERFEGEGGNEDLGMRKKPNTCAVDW